MFLKSSKMLVDEVENDSDVELQEFYFESDHVALRANNDYRNMLRYIITLESQKIAVIKDIDNLSITKRKALENPAEFINDLKTGNVDLPPSFNVPEIPNINWSKYGMSNDMPIEIKDKASDSEQENSKNILIRGRAFDQSKPQTFNQLWTCEEQKRLEELLVQYPEEEVEMRRWAKIAEALGNRTPKQVMSRVQKYFLKLQRAGLPIPGRRGFLSKSTYVSRHQRNLKILQRRSTFFPNQHVPVFMEEFQNDSECVVENGEGKQWTPIELMHAVYERRKIEEMSQQPLAIHENISCIGCKISEIVGTRWTDGTGSDWCSDCLIEHQPTTRLTPISRINSAPI